ncbi:MAG: cysteine--tRNA ligase [Rhizobiales bacterium]|nr:cysteine--tRNA ligase [Hyphomicrobiales bacterium]
MELKLYDTLTKEKRVFVPLDRSNVRMYVCGPTVYDFAHIGNARPVIVFDVLFRLLRHLYGETHVTYVRNITDVDDKINDRAARDYPGLPLNDAIRKVTEKTAAQFHADVAALGCLPPTVEPRATDFVLPRADGKADMKSLIQTLLDRGNAYVAIGTEGKEVLFDVTSMPDYGALSRRRLDEQMPGARIAVDAHKKNAEDFVLWKESGSREPGWKGEFVPNPSGGYDAEFEISRKNAARLGLNSRVVTIHGRPGWHIECSAMSAAYLGDVFDIHGGGLDLIFPHHENEIAQSRCAHGTHAMANYWLHNGFLQVEGEKMSKSLGNFVTIHELLADWPGDVVRLTMLKSHYRSPIDWRRDELQRSQFELRSWADIISNMALEPNYENPDLSLLDSTMIRTLSDDLNTPLAISRLHELADQARKDRSKGAAFAANVNFIGLTSLHRPGFFSSTIAANVPPEKANLFTDSMRLMLNFKNYSANNFSLSASSISSQLEERGIVVRIGRRGEVDVGFSGRDDEPLDVLVERLIADRSAARARKDFAESDRIRDQLAAMGVAIKDGKGADGKPVTTWEVAR